MTIRFLGTGTSTGTPMIGCDCPVCNSPDPRDARCRMCVAVISDSGTCVVADTPPEFRLLAVKAGLRRLDAVLITHCHMDHVAGFDDIRRFNTIAGGKPLPCYGSPETLSALRKVFPYISDKPNAQGLFRPMIDFTPVREPFAAGDIAITPVPVIHGSTPADGFVFECDGRRYAHIPDCSEIPAASMALLRNLDVLSLNCLRDRPHPTHLSLVKSLAYAKETGAKETFFVHMSHSLPHAETEKRLPPHVHLAYDGLDVHC